MRGPQGAVGCFFFFQLCICFGFCLPDLRLMPPLFESRHGKGIDCSGVRGEYQSWCCWGDGSAQTAAGTSCPARTSPEKAEQSKNIRVRRKKRAVRLLIALGDGPGWCLGGQHGHGCLCPPKGSRVQASFLLAGGVTVCPALQLMMLQRAAPWVRGALGATCCLQRAHPCVQTRRDAKGLFSSFKYYL